MERYNVKELDLKGVQPLNMGRRVRVFNNQLLPDICTKATTKESIKAAYNEVLRLGYKFVYRLEREDIEMTNEINSVHIAMHKAVRELFLKLRELEK